MQALVESVLADTTTEDLDLWKELLAQIHRDLGHFYLARLEFSKAYLLVLRLLKFPLCLGRERYPCSRRFSILFKFHNRGYSRIHPHPLPVRRKARLMAEGIKFQTPPLKKRAAEGTLNGEGGTPLIRRKRLLGEDWS